MNDHKQSLGFLTGLTSRLFNKLLARRFQEQGIEMTAEQWGVIVTLLNGEAMTQGEISDALYLEKSTVSRSIDGLEKKGWITRQKDVVDSRKKRVMLTDKAHEIATVCSEIASGVLSDAHKGLEEQQIKESRARLTMIAETLRELNE